MNVAEINDRRRRAFADRLLAVSAVHKTQLERVLWVALACSPIHRGNGRYLRGADVSNRRKAAILLALESRAPHGLHQGEGTHDGCTDYDHSLRYFRAAQRGARLERARRGTRGRDCKRT